MIPYFKQEKDWWCGPAVMQMALASFGIKKSQKVLAKELGAKNNDIGTKNSSMIKVAKKYFSVVDSKEKKSFSELKNHLKQKKAVIVSYFYEPDKTGHFAVVKDITSKGIILCDSEAGPNKKYSLKHFKKIWHDN